MIAVVVASMGNIHIRSFTSLHPIVLNSIFHFWITNADILHIYLDLIDDNSFSMDSKGLVLVTGVNGFIATRTVEAFLKAGYSVRGTARSKPTTHGLLDSLPEYKDKIEIIEVPDITAPGAFDQAVKGITRSQISWL